MSDRWWQEIEERAPEPEEFERRASAGPSQLAEAVVQYGSPGTGSAVLEAVFAQRALRALQEIAHEVSAESLSTVVSAPTDLDVLLEILLRPEARLPLRDPFTAARLRGVQASRRLLDAERTLLQFSRTQESSADQAGVNFLDSAGLSSRGMAEFLNILAGQDMLSTARQDAYVRTHPLTRDRVLFVENHVARSPLSDKAMPAGFAPPTSAPCSSSPRPSPTARGRRCGRSR